MSSVLSFRILAQDVTLIKSDGMETIGRVRHSLGAVLQQRHSEGLLLAYSLTARLRSQGGQSELQQDREKGRKTAFLLFPPLSEEQ